MTPLRMLPMKRLLCVVSCWVLPASFPHPAAWLLLLLLLLRHHVLLVM
jgi:hypothetical protein